MQLCQLAQDVFMSQGSLVEVDPPIRVCGDIHGQYGDLVGSRVAGMSRLLFSDAPFRPRWLPSQFKLPVRT